MGSDLVLDMDISRFKTAQSSFHFSFSFLPRAQRHALKTIYAFCRTTDDIVDTTVDSTKNVQRLREWNEELNRAIAGKSNYPLLNQLMSIAQHFHIPVVHFQNLIRGVEMDLTKNRYQTFDELKEYCYLVASTVGLMALEIFGPRNQKTREYAVNLGIALQMTNILRDVKIDARFGRIYIPRDDLQQFSCSESEILLGTFTPRFQKLMAFEAGRAEEFFALAHRSLPPEDRRIMFPATIMERIYYRTLRHIRDVEYNVFDHSIRVSRGIQFLIAIKYLVKQRIFGL